MIGQENSTSSSIPYVQGERPPNAKELSLWRQAEEKARRVNLLEYMMKSQFANLLVAHNFAKASNITLSEPTLSDLELRMNKAISEIERLKDDMCGVNQLELGVQLSSGGNDLDIVQPATTSFGWIIPAVIGAVIVVGIIARWAYLETEVSEITNEYNGILSRTDMALCGDDPNSDQCKSWETAKKTGGYYRRETIIDSVKSAISSVGTVAKKGIGAGLAIAIPLLLWMYMPRKKG